jgi:hypothetical protein|tara:strand:+ start:286 stop:477 length:192 start_codon:yes stop_codon:yes gene_type:complete
MKRTYARLDLNKTEFDIMCNHLGISLFGRNDLNNPLVKIILPKIKYTLQQEVKKGGIKKLKDV